MKIAIDISPVSKKSTSAHKVRGVGSYINSLIENLPKYDKTNDYVFVDDKKFSKDADLIHYPYFDPFFRTLPFRSGTKFVVTVHDLTPLVFPSHFPAGTRGKLNWHIQKRLLKKASMVVTDSDASGKDVKEIVGIKADRIKTVYLSADSNFEQVSNGGWKSEISKKYSLPEEFILYVGDATWNKNLPRLIEAVKRTSYTLVLVGKVWETKNVDSNPWNDDLRKVHAEIDGNSQFIKLGFVSDEDIVKIYNLASVLIMPSIYEGFGLPVLEAMQSGTPVISSRGGSLPEVGGSAVWYLDDLDAASIEHAIEKIMSDGALRAELSGKGLARAEKFSIKKSVEDLVKIYAEIINQSSK